MTPETEAKALRAQASFHKREAARHRKSARTVMARLAALCESNGIPIEKVEAKGRDK